MKIVFLGHKFLRQILESDSLDKALWGDSAEKIQQASSGTITDHNDGSSWRQLIPKKLFLAWRLNPMTWTSPSHKESNIFWWLLNCLLLFSFSWSRQHRINNLMAHDEQTARGVGKNDMRKFHFKYSGIAIKFMRAIFMTLFFLLNKIFITFFSDGGSICKRAAWFFWGSFFPFLGRIKLMVTQLMLSNDEL